MQKNELVFRTIVDDVGKFLQVLSYIIHCVAAGNIRVLITGFFRLKPHPCINPFGNSRFGWCFPMKISALEIFPPLWICMDILWIFTLLVRVHCINKQDGMIQHASIHRVLHTTGSLISILLHICLMNCVPVPDPSAHHCPSLLF